MTQARSGSTDASDGEGEAPPVIRDKRRIDPETGKLRGTESSTAEVKSTMSTQPDRSQPTAQGGGTPGNAAGDDTTQDATVPGQAAAPGSDLAEERLADLQRLQAEYVNYRKRVERDRDVVRGAAVFSVMDSLLPVMDDIQLAREHGDLAEGPFAAIAEKLEMALGKHGLVRYGEQGEEFDPAIHEALTSTPDADVETATVAMVMQPGYAVGEKIIRPARVGVKTPE